MIIISIIILISTISTNSVTHSTANTILIFTISYTLFAGCYLASHTFRFGFCFTSDPVGFQLCMKKNRTNSSLLVLITYLCFPCFFFRFDCLACFSYPNFELCHATRFTECIRECRVPCTSVNE